MRYVKITILFISMLTLLAGASVAPILGLLQIEFASSSELIIKSIISIPSLFIVLSASIFPLFAKRFKIKTIGIIGIILYLVGGVIGGFMPNIYMLLIFRAILGIGTGLLMPLSVGLVFLLLRKNEHSSFIGFQGFFNNVGGVIAMSLSGFLGSFDYRFGFLIYLLALFVGILVIVFLPKSSFPSQEKSFSLKTLKKIDILLICGFLAMLIFYVLPSDFSMVAMQKDLVSKTYLGFLLAFTPIGGMLSGLFFKKNLDFFKNFLPFFATSIYIVAYLLLYQFANLYSVLLGVFLVGFALGTFMPLLMLKAGKEVEKEELSLSMGLMSSSIFLGQFISSIVVDFLKYLLNLDNLDGGFLVAVFLSLILGILFVLAEEKSKLKRNLD